jgi:hypothetical protein
LLRVVKTGLVSNSVLILEFMGIGLIFECICPIA